jgi:dihydropyrimidine dehydrogenase (NAD+) subunit PreA
MVKNCAQEPAVRLPISGIGGIENWRDAAEFILMGAKTVQVCTAVMHYGFGIIRELVPGLERYMQDKGFDTIDAMCGLAVPNVKNWESLNLQYKVIAEIDDDKCIRCQLCYIACEDGAHQAIGLPKGNGNRVPYIIEENCVGCNLCSLVCPVQGCITMVRKDDGSKVENWHDRTEKGTIPTTFNDELAGGRHHHVPAPIDALHRH